MTDTSFPSVASLPSRRTFLVCVVALMTVLAGCGGTGTGGGGDGGGAGTAGTETGTDSTGTDDTTTNGAGAATGTGSGAGNATTANGTTSSANASGGSNASIRVAHMSPDAPDVAVSIDGQRVLSAVPFPEVSEYLTVPAGEHRIRVTEAGSPGTVLYDETVTLDSRPYTLVAAGEVSESTRTSTDFGVTLLADRTAPSSQNASVRLAHVSPDAGPVDVTVNGTGEVLFDNVTFSNASGYVEIPGGNYTLAVRRATASNDGPVVSDFTTSITNGTAYTVFAAGYVTPGRAPVGVSFEPIVVTDGLDATVRFAHMAPDAPSVDVYVNGRLADPNLPYSGTTEYFEVPAGNRTVTITPAGGSEPIFEGPVQLNASTNYTVVATGETSGGGDKAFRPVVLNDDLDTPTERSANVRLVHAAPDAPPVDVEFAEGDRVVFDDVAYANASDYTTIPGGNYTLETFVATDDDTGDDVATFRDKPLPGGASYTLFLTGYVTPADEPSGADIELVTANDTEDYVDRDTLD